MLWPGWCPQLPSITTWALKHRLCRVRAGLQGAALRSKVGNWGGHGAMGVGGSMEAGGVFGKTAMLILWREVRNLASCMLGASGLTVPCVHELVRSVR